MRHYPRAPVEVRRSLEERERKGTDGAWVPRKRLAKAQAAGGFEEVAMCVINCLGSFQNDPRSLWNDLNHVTLRCSVPRRPGRAGWLRRRPRADGRRRVVEVEVCAKPVPTLAEPRTFEKCVLQEEHSHQTFGEGGADIGRISNLACHRPRSAM